MTTYLQVAPLANQSSDESNQIKSNLFASTNQEKQKKDAKPQVNQIRTTITN